MALIIQSTANARDGKSMQVTLNAAPTGALTFFASKTPGTPAEVAPVLSSVGNVHKVQVRPDADGLAYLPSGYFVMAHDNNGNSEVDADWIQVGGDDFLTVELAEAIHDILYDNKRLFDKAMQRKWGMTAPKGGILEVQNIVKGSPSIEADAWPAISIHVQEVDWEQYFAIPATDRIPVSGAIQCTAMHQTDRQHEEIIHVLGGAVLHTLNRRVYFNIALDCGLYATEFAVSRMVVSEELDRGSGQYVATAVLYWSAKIVVGKDR